MTFNIIHVQVSAESTSAWIVVVNVPFWAKDNDLCAAIDLSLEWCFYYYCGYLEGALKILELSYGYWYFSMDTGTFI